ncbi:hypothetical protein FJZ20_01495 [Candidatus Pacearchaeota archaeon]|nr:hypothetical protein [Candidatus Pacearchaeota archaeon]
MVDSEMPFERIKQELAKERKIIYELNSFINYFKSAGSSEEKGMVSSQISVLRKSLIQTAQNIIQELEGISLFKQLSEESSESEIPGFIQEYSEESNVPREERIPFQKIIPQTHPIVPPKIETRADLKKKDKATPLERLVLKRIRRSKEKKVVKKTEEKPSKYIKVSSKFFYNTSLSLLSKGNFRYIERDIIKSNLKFVPAAYLSAVFFTTSLFALIGFVLAIFFLFFDISSLAPFVSRMTESLASRFFKIIWVLFGLPIIAFLAGYLYPSLERKALENKINAELPFATIHMSSISGSMVDPTKIFDIIVATGEYPSLEKEFIKLKNEINIYGYDLVTVLRNRAFNSPSKKLSDLLNGLATTITTGGNLPDFFEKRAQNLLFDYRLDMEKQARSSETFMDIYISVVIAAPMILMLLLMMMRISGLGIALSPGMITLVIILSVSIINIIFLAFLHIKQPPS